MARPRKSRPKSGHVRGILKTAKRRGWVKTRTKMQKGKCYWCNKPMDGDATAEHLIPLSKGGQDSIQNVVAAHKACNQEKGDMMPDEYRKFLASSETRKAR